MPSAQGVVRSERLSLNYIEPPEIFEEKGRLYIDPLGYKNIFWDIPVDA
jgi:hypothetical protein